MRQINKIVIHCSDSPQGRGDDADTIHRWHKERGFDGIGYHVVVLEDCEVQRGRPDYWEGAHVKGHNHDSIGICMIGQGSYTNAQLDSAAAVTAAYLNEYPEAKVVGHCELDSSKTCPMTDMDDFRLRVQTWVKHLQTS